jgi:hypothetical protein
MNLLHREIRGYAWTAKIAARRPRTLLKTEQVIFPAKTLALLERKVINFSKNRDRLLSFGMPKKNEPYFRDHGEQARCISSMTSQIRLVTTQLC